MRIYELPQYGHIILAHPSRLEEARIAADGVRLDWFLSDEADRDLMYWVRVTPTVMWAQPIFELPQRQFSES